MASAGVEVRGLRDFQRQLRAIDMARDLRKTNKDAAELVVEAARRKARSLGSVHAETARLNGIRAAAEQRRAKVILGSARTPFAFGAEFGAKQYPQFPPWRGNQHTDPDGSNVGYMIYPTIRETREEFLELYGDALEELAAKAFPD